MKAHRGEGGELLRELATGGASSEVGYGGARETGSQPRCITRQAGTPGDGFVVCFVGSSILRVEGWYLEASVVDKAESYSAVGCWCTRE